MEFFASASKGTEKALQIEMLELGFRSVRLISSGITFQGAIEEGWRACLYSRIAQRVYIVLARFNAESEIKLYNEIKSFDWAKYLTPRHTLSVSSYCFSSNLNHSGYVAQKTKDAVVDKLREEFGERPNVDRINPDMRIFVYLANNKATLYLDLSGTALFQRGYRLEKGNAPLKETLAAAIIMYSGWDRRSNFWDPMCGSGTIPIEAALLAANIAPGIFREKFAFERWADFQPEDREKMRTMRGEARKNVNHNLPAITASDINPSMIEIAKANARRAGVKISFKVFDFTRTEANNSRKFIISNPPFDKRLSVDKQFYSKLGAALSRMHNSTVGLIGSNPQIFKSIPAKKLKSIKLKNGDIDCEFRIFVIN